MNYRLIKQKRDKLNRDIEGLKMRLDMDYNDIVEEKKKQYKFFNNLLKTMSKSSN